MTAKPLNKLQQTRLNRLTKEFFPYWEAKRIVELNIPLKDPALKALRQERKTAHKTAQTQGIGTQQFHNTIRMEYAEEGLYNFSRRKYDVGGYLGLKARQLFPEPEPPKPGEKPIVFYYEEPRERDKRITYLMHKGFYRFEADYIVDSFAGIRNPELRREILQSDAWKEAVKAHTKALRDLTASIFKQLKADFPRAGKGTLYRRAQVQTGAALKNLFKSRQYNPFDYVRLIYPKILKALKAYDEKRVSDKKMSYADKRALKAASNLNLSAQKTKRALKR